MGIPVKKSRVKFCPFCGSADISHIECDVWACGSTDAMAEAMDKHVGDNHNCNRSFRIQHGSLKHQALNAMHRKEIGKVLDKLTGRMELK